jgi:hypothetical protein
MRRHRRRDYWFEDLDRVEEIAGFGDARIVKDLKGRIEIRGGTDDERAQAACWMRRFLTSRTGDQR